MKKLFAFAVFCLYILGSIGGFGFAVAGDSWPCAAGVVVCLLIIATILLKSAFDRKE